MKKLHYIQPEMSVEKMAPNAFVMTPPSPGSDYNPSNAPRHVAPPVPGDGL